ncbi:MAG: RecX family transcriptional regulator [Firmicutes bacterium]|nr:RecX family transcriptional regulator [Bacillota bacterium]
MFEKALNYVLSYPKTERQVRQWLSGKGATLEEADEVVEKLKDYGYINDEGYAKLFVEQQRSKQGRGAILTKMYQKGLSREIIEANTAEIDEAIQKDLAKQVAQKWMQGREDSRETRRKLFGHLMRKGFEIDLVRSVVNGGDFEDWD